MKHSGRDFFLKDNEVDDFARISYAVLALSFFYTIVYTIERDMVLRCNEEMHTSTYDFGTREHTTHNHTCKQVSCNTRETHSMSRQCK